MQYDSSSVVGHISRRLINSSHCCGKNIIDIGKDRKEAYRID